MLQKITANSYTKLLLFSAKFADLFLYFIAALITFYQQFGGIYPPALYQIAMLVALLLIIPIFSFFGVYQSLRGRSFSAYLRPIVPALITLMLALAGIAFVTKTGAFFSRYWFLLWHFYALIFLIVFRIGLRQALKFMRKRGLNHKRVIILGLNDVTVTLMQRITSALWIGFDVVAVFANRKTQKNSKLGANISVQKIPRDLAHYVEENQINEVWVAEEKLLRKIVPTLRHNVITMRYFPAIFGLELINHSITEIIGLPVIDLISSPMTGINRVLKAMEDKVLSFLILFIISPVFFLTALLVKLTSSGPIFYRQKRHGWDGKPIHMYKFRTMYEHIEPEGTVTQATADDPRITKIGKFLRCTSLDELPQFINVLQGRMSIVGPRPHAIEHNEHYQNLIASYMQRHQVKPGITGWAQIHGLRGVTDTLDKMEKRVQHDLYYIEHWSLWLDLKIIFLTLWKGFVHKNAY